MAPLGSLALLKLPSYTTLSLDGSATKTLRKDEDLLVVVYIPLGFHLLSVRAGCSSSEESNMSMSIGLLILFRSDEDEEINAINSREKLFVARQYDQQTEELSSASLDDVTSKNLFSSIEKQKRNDQSRQLQLLPYNQFTSNVNEDGNVGGINKLGLVETNSVWKCHLTNLISQRVLERHNLTGRGDKIIPGSMNTSNEDEKDLYMKESEDKFQDGVSLKYDPIPCFESSEGVRPQSHKGTRRFLASLSPSEKTAVFTRQYDKVETGRGLGDYLFQKILMDYYGGKWEDLIGEMQLSFVVFVCCSCLASLEHWRDCIYMLSLVDGESIVSNSKLFESMMTTLKYQLDNFDCSIFQDDDFAAGNIFIPAIKRIVFKCEHEVSKSSESNLLTMHEAANQLSLVIRKTFLDSGKEADNDVNVHRNVCTMKEVNDRNDVDDENDDDGPVVVTMEEVQASLDRTVTSLPGGNILDYKTHREEKERFPFLFAAVSSDEDIMMTCARILDEQRDVTLVREAAAYLEEIEAKR